MENERFDRRLARAQEHNRARDDAEHHHLPRLSLEHAAANAFVFLLCLLRPTAGSATYPVCVNSNFLLPHLQSSVSVCDADHDSEESVAQMTGGHCWRFMKVLSPDWDTYIYLWWM